MEAVFIAPFLFACHNNGNIDNNTVKTRRGRWFSREFSPTFPAKYLP